MKHKPIKMFTGYSQKKFNKMVALKNIGKILKASGLHISELGKLFAATYAYRIPLRRLQSKSMNLRFCQI